MRTRCAAVAVLGALALIGIPGASADDKDWKTLFDGKTLDGWRVTGAVWKVEDGAIVGHAEQDLKAGYCMTNERYADCEIELDFKIDWPFDSGLFLRTTDDGKAYQVTIDNRENGYIGAIYVGGLPGGREKSYLQEPAEKLHLRLPSDECKLFKKDDWNHLYARIEGKAPHIVVKLNGESIIDVTDAEARHQADGPIGLQVHGGSRAEADKRVRYKNIRIRPLAAAQAGTPAAAPTSVTLAVSGMT